MRRPSRSRQLCAALVSVVIVGGMLLGGGGAAAQTTPSPSPAPAPAGTSIDGVAPIIVLLDVSGSMNEDDGAGTVKLQGAKSAVRDIVTGLSGSTVFGLWDFPTDGCSGGGYVSAPAPLSPGSSQVTFDDRSAVLGRVEQIVADGSTPTGPALRALADDLVARGYAGATIVLVSDGESTCGEPPCEVADQIVSEGFAVTVPTIGFRTSETGSEELSCIAAATGAKTYSAGDSTELADQLDQLVRAQLDLTVRYDTTPLSGSSTKITAVLTHTGGEAARDVRVALTFTDSGEPTRMRAAIPPIVRIGNIPAGATVERSWTVGTRSRGDSTTTTFTLSAWGSNTPRVVAEGEYTLSTPSYVKAELGPLFGQVTETTPLIIFGDSYSSGEGVGANYDRTPGGVSADCHRSQETYLGRIFSEAEKKIVACSGAVASALYWSSNRSMISQIQELNSFGYVPGAGVLTFGGNDIGFETVVSRCISPLSDCRDPLFIAQKLAEASALRNTLPAAYRQAWSAMNTPELRSKRGGSYVPLFVLPYPLVTHEAHRGACYQFDAEEVLNADQLGKTVNDAVRDSVETVRKEGYEVYFVADVTDAVRPDHTLCESGDDAYINGWIPAANSKVARSESVHPKASGYLAETDAIIRWSKTAAPLSPQVSDVMIAENLKSVRPAVDITWPPFFDPNDQLDALTVERSGTVSAQGSGFEPGSPVTAVLHSDPVVLGTLVAGQNGEIEGTLRIPASVPVGQHELVVSGVDSDGEFLERTIPVVVVEPVPLWVWAALLGAVLAVVGGAAALAVAGVVSRRPGHRYLADSNSGPSAR